MTHFISNYWITLQNANQDSMAVLLIVFGIGFFGPIVFYKLSKMLFHVVKYLVILIGRDCYAKHMRKRGIIVTFKN